MATKKTRVVDPFCPDAGQAMSWYNTLRAKARKASAGPRGQKWYFSALASLLAKRINEALLQGRWDALEQDMDALSGRPEIQTA